jgi:magnesium transporter
MSYTEIRNTEGSLRWIDIVKPTTSDRKRLEKEFSFFEGDVLDAFRPTLRSKITKWEHYIFLVLMVPVYNHAKHAITVDEVDFFIGKDYIITVHQGSLPPIKKLWRTCETGQQGKKDCEMMSQDAEHALFEVLDDVQEYVYPMIDNINDDLEHLKKVIFLGENTRQMVKEILQARRNITDMRKAMRSHAPTITHLIKHEGNEKVLQLVQHPSLFEDLIDYAEEIWGTLESDKEMIEALEDANDALISHTLNDTIKVLTGFSAILLPAGVVAGLFGMNASHIPFAGHPLDFWLFMVLTCLVSFLLLVFFWKKKWL